MPIRIRTIEDPEWSPLAFGPHDVVENGPTAQVEVSDIDIDTVGRSQRLLEMSDIEMYL